MQKCSARPAGSVDDRLCQLFEKFLVVVARIALHIDETGPTATDTNYFVSFAQRAQCDSPDSRIQPRYVTSSGKDGYYSFQLPMFAMFCLYSVDL